MRRAGFNQGALGVAPGGALWAGRSRVRPSRGCAASRRGAPSAPPAVGEQRLSGRVSQQADLLLNGGFVCLALIYMCFFFFPLAV